MVKKNKELWNKILCKPEECAFFVILPYFWKGDNIPFRVCINKLGKQMTKGEDPLEMLNASTCKGICRRFRPMNISAKLNK